MFLAIGALTLVRTPQFHALAAALALGGGLVALYLIGVQLVSLRATCIWCLAGDGALVGLAGLALRQLGLGYRRR